MPPEKSLREITQINHPNKSPREITQRNHPEKFWRNFGEILRVAGCGLRVDKKRCFFAESSTAKPQRRINQEV
ncbi:hypothetical protein AM228_26085 [Planktothricoides sp. SR001]|nr:hypothetical protein AM228_26085 [Planktothricoides sp. SR001]